MKISSGTKFVRYRFRYFLTVPFFPIPVPRLHTGTIFSRYWFRDFSPVPISANTVSDTTKKMKKSWYWEFPLPVRHTLIHVMLYFFLFNAFLQMRLRPALTPHCDITHISMVLCVCLCYWQQCAVADAN